MVARTEDVCLSDSNASPTLRELLFRARGDFLHSLLELAAIVRLVLSFREGTVPIHILNVL